MATTTKNDIIPMMEEQFKKAPVLPENIRQALVNITPWIALIFGILGILAGLSAVGAMFGGVSNTMMVLVSGILTIVSSVLLLMAYPKTKVHKIEGWRLIFWSTLVSFISSLLVSSFQVGAILGAIVWAVIEFYILFQIKSHYK